MNQGISAPRESRATDFNRDPPVVVDLRYRARATRRREKVPNLGTKVWAVAKNATHWETEARLHPKRHHLAADLGESDSHTTGTATLMMPKNTCGVPLFVPRRHCAAKD